MVTYIFTIWMYLQNKYKFKQLNADYLSVNKIQTEHSQKLIKLLKLLDKQIMSRSDESGLSENHKLFLAKKRLVSARSSDEIFHQK